MARCGCGGSGSGGGGCNCSLVDGNGTGVSGVGSSGSPYQVAVKPDPAAGNLVTVGAAGVLVSCEAVQDCVGGAFGNGLAYNDAGNQMTTKLSANAGNTIGYGTDGGLYAAAGALSLGCGMTTDGSGKLTFKGVDYSTLMRRTCDDEFDGAPVAIGGDNTRGQGIYCDDNGILRTKPEKFTVSREQSIGESYTAAQAVPFDPTVLTLTIANPSTVWCLCGTLELACRFSLDSTIDANPRLDFVFDLDGDGVLDQTVTVWSHDTRGVSGTSRQAERPVLVRNLCLDPGETKTVSFRPHFDYGDAHAGGFSSVYHAGREIRFVGGNV